MQISALRQVSEVETKFTVTGEAQARQAMEGVAGAQDKVARSADVVATSTEKVEKRQLSMAAASEKMMRQLDKEYAALQKLDAYNRQIERFSNAGLYGSDEVARLQKLATDKYGHSGGVNDNHPGGGGLSSYDKMFIKYQGFDVASSLGSGANPMTVAFQQGPQVLQQLAGREGGLGAGLKQLGVSALGLVTPFTVAATAVTAIGAAFILAGVQAGRQQEALEKATRGVGAATGATASQLDALAKANAEAGRVSVGTAQTMVAAYNSSGQIGTGVFASLIQSTERYAKLTGQDVPTATAELVTAFNDVGAGVETIAAKIGGLDDRTRSLIVTQAEQGDKSGAQATAAEYLRSTVEANTNATTGWAAAWNTAATAAGNYWQAAMKIAGIKLGTAPEGAADATARLTAEVDKANKIRSAIGAEPLGLGDSRVTQRDTAALILDTQNREAAARAAEERANQASRTAGNISRATDPNYARLSELRTQQSQLSEAIADPLARSKLADFGQTEIAYLGVTRAIESMVDANGKLVSSEEMTRRGNQLQIDAANAKTDAEKALVAQRQKAFDLVGKTIPGSDARSQIDMAGRLSLANASEKAGGGSKADPKDEYDRAVKSAEDRTRRMAEDAATYGMGAAAVAKYRTETELLTAAKRAERDITPALTSQIEDYATKAAEAASKQEALRDSMQTMDGIRNTGGNVFKGLLTDMRNGASMADTFTHALTKIEDKLIDMASNSIIDSLLGKSGSSGGLLGAIVGETGGAGEVLA